MAEMTKGVRKIALDLLAEEKLEGAMCLGGAEGAALGTRRHANAAAGHAQTVAPAGPGKRYFASLMGTRDVMVMHSVADISGLNPLTKAIFDNAAAAMAGMVKRGSVQWRKTETGKPGRKYVALTVLSNTAKGVAHIKERLAERGIGTILFHANGVGGPAMEELAEDGMFLDVYHYTASELVDQLFGGYHQGGEAAGAGGDARMAPDNRARLHRFHR